jgi:DNA-directed RNA polymerase subunit RPC12/RpoP
MRSCHSVPSRTAKDSRVQTAEVNFVCSQCGSFYEVVRAKALPETADPRIKCPTCSAPLPAREAQFALKYFLWRKANCGWERMPLGA